MVPRSSKVSWNKQAEKHQIQWRRRHPLAGGKWGDWQKGVQKEYILPAYEWHLGLWQPIRKSVAEYIRVSGILPHRGKHNLKSSWAQCINLFYPARWDKEFRSKLAGFLRQVMDLDVTAIEDIEFEYAAPGKLEPKRLLGEMGGIKGSMQTSPDVAILFSFANGKSGLYLIENKYVEHHFYPCSGAKKILSKEYSERGLAANPNPKRCMDVMAVYRSPDEICQQQAWGRKYWSLLKSAINETKLSECGQCPAMTDGYQLFRQQALAQGIANSGLFDSVISGVAYDQRNSELRGCLQSIGLDDFTVGWADLFKTGVHFRCFEHQKFIQHVRDHSKGGRIEKWADYLSARYDY